MKKILVVLILLCTSISVCAEVMLFRSQTYSERRYNGYSWSNWKPEVKSSVLIKIDPDAELVTIYSPVTQYYNVTGVDDVYTDGDGDRVLTFYFVDGDGDEGIMHLMARKSGRYEIYIRFGNIQWVYSVRRIQ